MVEKITKIIQRASKVDYNATTSRNIKTFKGYQAIMTENLTICDENSKNNATENSLKKKEHDTINLKKYVKKSPNGQAGRIERNSNKMLKKLEQSFAVNLCLCSGQEAPSKLSQSNQRKENLKPSWKQKKSKDTVTNVPSLKQSKPISTLSTEEKDNTYVQPNEFSANTLCPSNCICFHKMPSYTSIDKLLETLTKWNSSLNEIVENVIVSDNKKDKENMNKKSFKSDLVNLETTMNYQVSQGNCTKSTTFETNIPPTTDSEYIGAVNLDKSNYNTCTCPVNGNSIKIIHGDEKSTPLIKSFHCINSNVCKCKSSIDIKRQPIELQQYKYVPSNITKVSQVYSVDVHKPQLKCMETETDSLSKNISKKSVQISGETFIHDVVRKSQLFPNNADYFVKFLGVTLNNTGSGNKRNQIKGRNVITPFLEVTEIQEKNMMKKETLEVPLKVDSMIHNNNTELQSGLENFENKDISQDKLYYLNDTNSHSKISDEKENSCVCCNKRGDSKDLELNAFNLLEEHIKGKLDEFQRSSCKPSLIPPEEEKLLFNTILLKVREVISESTKGFNCICCDENGTEGSWARAYGMLQEYLKVKMKRVQCPCVSSEENVESILPPILKKVCNLIEKDFQRLKEKYNSDDYDYKHSNIFQTSEELNKIGTKNDLFSNELIVSTDNDDHHVKTEHNILINIASCMPVDKSCEVLDSVFKDLSTSEKNVSCEFKIYGTECNCQYTLTEPSRNNQDFIVNQCTEFISINGNMKTSISTAEVNSISANSSIEIKLTSSKEKKENDICLIDDVEARAEVNIPSNIGCTLSCKSLVQSNTDKIDCIWKSLTDETCPRKCSHIMHEALTEEKFEDNIDNNSKDINNFQSSNNNIKNINDIEVSTLDNGEVIVLKYSNDKFNETMTSMKTFDEISVGTKCTNHDYSSCWHECGPEQLSDTYQSDKNFLYDSLQLPTTDNFTKSVVSKKSFDTEDRSEKCDCSMVPICHVKMLVKNIEKKLVQLKCTCDSLSSQVCPVHSGGKFYVD